MKAKGRILSRGTAVLSLECLPEKVPPQIEVDISGLEELDDSIYVKDIVLDPDILVQDDPELLVVKVSEVVIKVEEEKPVVEEEVEVEGEEGEEAEEGEEGEAPAKGAAEKPAAEAREGKKAPEKKE
jgi:hypothetical protein